MLGDQLTHTLARLKLSSSGPPRTILSSNCLQGRLRSTTLTEDHDPVAGVGWHGLVLAAEDRGWCSAWLSSAAWGLPKGGRGTLAAVLSTDKRDLQPPPEKEAEGRLYKSSSGLGRRGERAWAFASSISSLSRSLLPGVLVSTSRFRRSHSAIES